MIEDDTGAELVHDGPVPSPIAAADPEAPVVLVKSYAKTVLPGLRLGVISAPPGAGAARAGGEARGRPLHGAAAGPGPGRLPGPAEAAEHLERMRGIYRERRDAFLRALERRLGGRATWLEPAAGFNLWLRLPDGAGEEEIFARAAERGVVVSPGRVYVPPGVGTRHLRLSFSTATEAEADRGLQRLARALRDATDGPRRQRSPEDDPFAV